MSNILLFKNVNPLLLKFNEQKAWIADTFPRDRRYENLILESENILTADTVRYVSAR